MKKNKTRRHGGKLAAILALSLGAAAAYIGTDSYINKKIRARYQQMSEVLAKSKFAGADESCGGQSKRFDELSFREKWEYIAGIRRMEDRFESNLPNFVSYVRRNHDLVARLTSHDSEPFGYIFHSGNSFNIIPATEERDQMIKYSSEIADGNFAHKLEIIRFSERYGRTFRQCDMTLGDFSRYLDFMKAYTEAGRQPMPNSEEIIFRTASGELLALSNDVAKKHYEDGIELFSRISQEFKLRAPLPLTLGLFSNASVFSRFHANVLNDRFTEPSEPDIAYTHTGGPTILFSQYDGMIYVYGIHRGKPEKLYQFQSSLDGIISQENNPGK